MRDVSARTGRTLARYRLFFKTSVGFIAVGFLMSALGIALVLAHEDGLMLSSGLLLISLGGINAYKVVVSTARILSELEST